MNDAEPARDAPVPAPPRGWGRRALWVLVALAAVLLLAWIGAAFIPRWWAQRVGDQVEGSIAAGITLGLVYGFLFTILPLAAVGAALRRRRGWKAYVAFAALATALAAPNLFTLGIAVGGGNAAHAGDRILDVEAPGFRGATAAGALVAALLAIVVGYLVVSRRQARAELARLRAREEERGAEDGGA
ncbi:MAG: hypothetical protein RMM28_02845 [Thermoleophilia bacterium]|nr:hypothetical protein [Gaiellaceae bacterium]MDW8338059.1 hypothetical protein [Thermoleophilia bacterium]